MERRSIIMSPEVQTCLKFMEKSIEFVKDIKEPSSFPFYLQSIATYIFEAAFGKGIVFSDAKNVTEFDPDYLTILEFFNLHHDHICNLDFQSEKEYVDWADQIILKLKIEYNPILIIEGGTEFKYFDKNKKSIVISKNYALIEILKQTKEKIKDFVSNEGGGICHYFPHIVRGFDIDLKAKFKLMKMYSLFLHRNLPTQEYNKEGEEVDHACYAFQNNMQRKIWIDTQIKQLEGGKRG